MIQKQTYLKVADNSGALEVMCIHIVGSTRKRYARLGDIIICAVKKGTAGAGVKKSDVVPGVIVRTKKEFRRDDGSYIRFGDNAVVILNKEQEEMVGTRVFGPVAREIRKKFPQIISQAEEVL